MSDLIPILLLSFIGSIVALIGAVIFLYVKPWSRWLSHNSTSFAAGVLITVSIVGLLPEAVDAVGEKAFIVVLVAFFCSFLFEHFFVCLHHHECDSHDVDYGSVSLIIIGDTIHNFIDGVAIAASYMTMPGLGILTSVSTFMHEVPHEIGDFGILLKAGWPKRKIIIINIMSAAAAIIGAVLLYFINPPQIVTGYLLAISAGIFLFLGASDFLPHIGEGKSKNFKSVLPLLIGIFVMLITIMAIPHSHENENQENRYDNNIQHEQQ